MANDAHLSAIRTRSPFLSILVAGSLDGLNGDAASTVPVLLALFCTESSAGSAMMMNTQINNDWKADFTTRARFNQKCPSFVLIQSLPTSKNKIGICCLSSCSLHTLERAPEEVNSSIHRNEKIIGAPCPGFRGLGGRSLPTVTVATPSEGVLLT